MRGINARMVSGWAKLGPRFLPFADAATSELQLSRLLRLSLFQVSVGMAAVLLIGTLNRVMIVELGVPAWLVAVMVALPLIAAPFRAIVGFRSDTHKSMLGWRRVPYLWMGTMLQFGGLAIMPFALIVLSGDTTAPPILGRAAAALAFLLVGAGLHTVQTVGLALATDLAPIEKHPKVVGLLCMMLLLGMVCSALFFGFLLRHFTELRLIQVVQGSAAVTVLLNGSALWKQEPRNPALTSPTLIRPSFLQCWREFAQGGGATRRLVALGFGTVSFSMQDVLLEPYGGQVLHLTVGQTTALTALLALGGLTGFATAAKLLGDGADPYRLAGGGALAGVFAFSALIFAAPLHAVPLFVLGVALIGFGAGLFAHCTLTAAMGMAGRGQIGLALGIWGAVQASAAGVAVAAGGLIRDGVAILASRDLLGSTLADPATGYGVVYIVEIVLLFATLVAVGPLVRLPATGANRGPSGVFPLAHSNFLAKLQRGEIVMRYGAITDNIDVAQLVLYAFWLFFAGLILYLRREDHREGYPMVGDTEGHIVLGFPPLPVPKEFLMAGGAVVMSPRAEAPEVFAAKRAFPWVGAPFQPTGNPMVDGVGPASWARRHDEPELAYDDGLPKIVPLRTAADFYLAAEDYDPRGYDVVALDGVAVGKVVDAWIDRSEYIVRYLEVELDPAIAPRRVILPMHFSQFRNKQMLVKVVSINSFQFPEVPALRNADVITPLEEDKITAYYAGGLMYSTASRIGPIL